LAETPGIAGGCSIDFNRQLDHLFVVGTEEGSIHLYSKAYNTQMLRTYEGHHRAVYAVKWNPFHPRIFISCSADWTVKIWEINCSVPVLSFEMDTAVGDVAWAPYSSTVFAAVTADGMLRVFDLSAKEGKHTSIGELLVEKKGRLTHVSFNPKQPTLCVGDDRGNVRILKLTANLHRMTAPTLEDVDKLEEVQKLDRLLVIPEKDDSFALGEMPRLVLGKGLATSDITAGIEGLGTLLAADVPTNGTALASARKETSGTELVPRSAREPAESARAKSPGGLAVPSARASPSRPGTQARAR